MLNFEVLKNAFVLCFAISGTVAILERSTNVGENVTLPCAGRPADIRMDQIEWVRTGRERTTHIEEDGGITLTDLKRNDTGLYTCKPQNSDVEFVTVNLTVNGTPAKLKNVTVVPSTVLAMIQWEVEDDGGYPISGVTVRYRQNDEDDKWHYVNSELISAATKQVDIYKLNPNSTYLIQVWASNKLGDGIVTNVTVKTLNDNQEIELARHLLEGADTFDTRVWLAAVAIVMSTLLILTLGTCFVLYRDCHIPMKNDRDEDEDPERIELIPNVILNPGYYEETPSYLREDDEFTVYLAGRTATAVRV